MLGDSPESSPSGSPRAIPDSSPPGPEPEGEEYRPLLGPYTLTRATRDHSSFLGFRPLVYDETEEVDPRGSFCEVEKHEVKRVDLLPQ